MSVDLISAIVGVAERLAAALRNLKDLKEDSAALLKLVRAIQAVVQRACDDLDDRKLQRAETKTALESVQEALNRCLELVNTVAAKSRAVKFLRSGDYVADLKAATARLSQALQLLQTALGVEQHADLKRQFEDVLQGMERHAVALRQGVEQQLEAAGAGGQADLRTVVMECLRVASQEGLLGAAGAGGGDRLSPQEVQDLLAALQEEADTLWRSKQEAEALYLQQIMAALELGDQAAAAGQAPGGGTQQQAPAAAAPWLPANFRCPVTHCVMRDPVIVVESGQTYERAAITQHLSTRSTDPVTNVRLSSKALAPNIGLRGAIEDWLQRHGLTHDQADELEEGQQPPNATSGGGRPPANTAAAERQQAPASISGQPYVAPGPAGPSGSALPYPVIRMSAGQGLSWELPQRAAAAVAEDGWVSISDNTWSSCAPPPAPPVAAASASSASSVERNAAQSGWAAPPSSSAASEARGAQVAAAVAQDGWVSFSDNTWSSFAPPPAPPVAAASASSASSVEQNVAQSGSAAPPSSSAASEARGAQAAPQPGELRAAARAGDVTAVRRILLTGAAHVDERNTDGWTPLALAAFFGHTEAVGALLGAGADTEAANTNGDTPLNWAAHEGHTEAVNVLLAAGANIQAATKSGWTPLHCAAWKGHPQAAKALLAGGANTEAGCTYLDTEGGAWTPLHLAAFKGHTEAVGALLGGRADTRANSERGRTPLHLAAAEGRTEAVKALLAGGANANAADEDDRTPFHWAARNGYTEAMRALLSAGADIDAAAKDGRTPLHLAAGTGHHAAVRALLAAGADVDAAAKDGASPLHYAVMQGHTEATRALLAAGANKKAKDKRGKTALDLAKEEAGLFGRWGEWGPMLALLKSG
ncbi:hypothetical protein HYH03_000969 [Edaphochlamys debaryana]|uniref:U-box domain-containing protein n=1 Tax=Edaphochlamys debaryana TaxID=47281 RepID=A0A835YNW0_9CHLO|nr:hypothetical protein HYH03_000969 [Edaphochlamys debaryana]|eukprot:KAG2501154.1 hypothetical protein HYH03_000969 [Edaphochlamys debaryana]